MSTKNFNSLAIHEKSDRPLTQAEYLEYAKKSKQQKEVAQQGKYFLSADEKMLRIQDIIDQVAVANVPVLVTGESGVGKEVIAKSIHEASIRKGAPFVAINCAAIPAALLEGELFGYEKGAFTGAHQRHLGKFEQAHGGTLLLDEVTEMDPALQAKLLRTLQEKEIERIGGNGPHRVDVRVIATTNRNITEAVEKGQFRQDLYYRLHVIHIEVPALRDRKKDIDLLAHYFLAQFAKQFDKGNLHFSNEAIRKLNQYNWPGNVREMQNVIQRAVLLSQSNTITPHEIPIEVEMEVVVQDSWISQLPIGRTLQDVETKFILETLKHHSGNRTHAAKTLGISLRTLRNKINEYTAMGIDVPAPTIGRATL